MTASRRYTWLRTAGATGLALVLIEYLAVPQIVHATSDLTMVLDASHVLLAVALVLEISSLVAYTMLTRAVLPPRVRLRFGDQFRIDLSGLGFSHVVPGGGASAAALRFRLMLSHGISADDAAATAAVQTALAVVGLVALFASGVLLAGVGLRSHPGYAVAGVAAIGFLAAVVVTMRASSRRPRAPHRSRASSEQVDLARDQPGDKQLVHQPIAVPNSRPIA